MRKIKTFIVMILVMFYCLKTDGQEFKLSEKSSTINWIGKAAFNSYAPKGTLKSKSGTLILNGKNLKSLKLTIDMNSLHHENKDLKAHLRNKDFFEVKKYRTALFNLVEPATIVEGKNTLVGDMTIKNRTNRVQLEVTIQITSNELKISYDIELDRTKYDVTFNSPSFFKKLKDNAIADIFKIKGTFVFAKI